MNRTTGRSPGSAWATLLLILGTASNLSTAAGEISGQSPAGALDYFEPKVLAGNIYDETANPKTLLFTFRRTATRSNATVQVSREYRTKDGTLAAREQVVYEAGQLVSCELDDLQTGARASFAVRPGPTRLKERRLLFEYARRKGDKPKTTSEELQPNVLVNDMLTCFIAANWEKLMTGASVPFRLVALERAETVGFKMLKVAESSRSGQAVVRIKMEPTSLIIAALVKPIYFTFEKGGQHRILDYSGRTTPKLARDGKWKDLDALTVYDWK
jgi:hypothetical protein